MALVMSDGLGWFTTTGGAAAGWPTVNSIDATGGRNGRQAIVSDANEDNTRSLARVLDCASGRTIQFSFYVNYATSGTMNRNHYRFRNVGGDSIFQLTVGLGNFRFYSGTTGNGNNFISSAANWYNGVQSGVWYRYTTRVFFNNGSGTIEVWRDGTKIIDQSGLDTIGVRSSDADVVDVQLSPAYSAGGTKYNDLVVLDEFGDGLSALDGDFGAYIINTYLPDADGDLSEYTAQGGGANYLEVDDADPDGSTTYNSSNTDGQQDLFSMESIGNPRTIYAVKLGVNCAVSPSSSASRIRGIAKSGSTTEIGGEVAVSSETYSLKEFEFPYDPDAASGAWDQTSVNAAQFGYQSVIT